MLVAELGFESPLAALPVCAALVLMILWITRERGRRRRPAVTAISAGLVAGGAAGLLAARPDHPLLSLLLPAALLVLCGSASSAAYPSAESALSKPARRACRTLRFAALLLLTALLLRPEWAHTAVDWHKPSLAFVLDSSKSMSIEELGHSRADRVNAELAGNVGTLRALADRFELHRLAPGESPVPLSDWAIHPDAELSALSAALTHASRLRDADGGAPHAIVLISDGAENVASPEELLNLAAALDRQGTALLAVAAASRADDPPIAWEPLRVPGRVRAREQLAIPVAVRVRADTDSAASLEARWDDAPEPAADYALRVRPDDPLLRQSVELAAPSAGVHRLTLRLTLDAPEGPLCSEKTALIEVMDDRIQVLLIEQRARTELGFISRALSDPKRFERTLVLLQDAAAMDVLRDRLQAGCDVILIGESAEDALDPELARRLTELVQREGAGVMLQGGPSLATLSRSRSPLLALLPAGVVLRPAAVQTTLSVTEAGRNHPLFAVEGAGATDPAAALAVVDVPLPSSVQLADLSVLSQVLGVGANDDPLLVAAEVGAGRVLMSAVDATWPWALASDAGAELQARFWRGAIAWLANRRPSAWIATDASQYLVAGVRRGRQPIRIRAGVTGFEREPRFASAQLRLRSLGDEARSEQPPEVDSRPAADSAPASAASAPAGWLIPLRRDSGEWRAELPRDFPAGELTVGSYELELAVEVAEPGRSPGSAATQRLAARARLVLVDRSLELEPPTQNLELLEQAAARTADAGGAFLQLDQLGPALQRLAARDLRRRVEREIRTSWVRTSPAWVLTMLVLALGAEWAIRRRWGWT